MPFWPDTLVREIAERRVLFFVGAGLSKAAHPAFPDWAGLLITLSSRLSTKRDRDLVARLIRQGRMLDAAQVVRDGTSKADLNADLRATFQVRPVPHFATYEDLLRMDPKNIATTNYDEFLEKNFEYFSGGTEAHSITKHNSKHLMNDLRSPIRSIIKLHGCVTDPSDLVLDRSSYFDAKRENPGIFQIISSLMTVNTVVFLGYGIGDPDIQLILEDINIYGKSDNPHYALMSKFDHKALKDSVKHTYNVEILEYPAGDHAAVPRLINELRQNVEALRTARGIV